MLKRVCITPIHPANYKANLSDNSIGSEGVQVLLLVLVSLQYISQLVWFDLFDKSIGSDGAHALISITATHSQSLLISICLIMTLSQRVLKHCQHHFNTFHISHGFKLANNNIGSKSAKALSTSPQYIPELTDLNLSCNDIE